VSSMTSWAVMVVVPVALSLRISWLLSRIRGSVGRYEA
jgi:hypothetical protein